MRKRLLVRGADVGYTLAFDLGIKKAMDEGVMTCADVMFDSPHTVEALKWLKERPWISIGWHRHLWESPVLPASEVPSLVDEEGRFKWRHNLNHLKKEATYEDAYKELCAEMELCKEIYGELPVAASYRDNGTELERAMGDVVKKYDLDINFWNDSVITVMGPDGTNKQPRNPKEMKGERTLADKQDAYDLSKFKDYDPALKILNLKWTDKEEVFFIGGHPGYCDDHILAESTCTIHRCRELQMNLDPRVFEFIKENKVELVNIKDVKYGTHTYQEHLKEINSPLYIG